VSDSTAYAVAASLMNRPVSDAGSRALFSDAADHWPVPGTWCPRSQSSPLPTRGSDDGTPALIELELIEPYLFLDRASARTFARSIAHLLDR